MLHTVPSDKIARTFPCYGSDYGYVKVYVPRDKGIVFQPLKYSMRCLLEFGNHAMSKTIYTMIIHHTNSLHISITNCRADKFKAAFL